ncbi:protein NRT1/ PTR FAMILY 5.8-like [Euphorbia lathyris]|uniref:protein NRT1/ PTR FAMILY 5.8-like n=1 Tax=Euphorbia lathyris TaxID=212925 RepID=UPI003314371C
MAAVSERINRINNSCVLLMVLAGIERFAFKGVASNMVTYLTEVVKMSNSAAAKTANTWCGFTFILPLFVASIADSCGDNKYPTIMASSFLYLMGLLALSWTALTWAWYPANNILSSTFLFSSLCLISLGQGIYNPSLQALGADQIHTEHELPCSTNEKNLNTSSKSFFFQWWYFSVCAGSLLGVIVMSYIQDTFGWVLGFSIPTLAMLFSISLFWCCSSKNYDPKIELRDVFRIIKDSASRIITLRNDKSPVSEIELEAKPLCYENHHHVDNVQSMNNVDMHHLENVKVVVRLVPIWTMLLMFSVIFQQPATFFTKQGVTMRRNIGSSFMIPPATLQSAITLSIILLMPLYDSIFIPIVRIITGNKNGINVMQRIGIGMLLSIVAMIISALVEQKRLEINRKTPHVETVPLSILWLLPQYILLGLSDVFTVVGMQEFFYSEVPVRMKTMGIALYTSVFGVGSFLSALLISLVEVFSSSRGGESWFIDDMSKARLDKYYWLLAFFSALSMLFYIILCKFFMSTSDLDEEDCK